MYGKYCVLQVLSKSRSIVSENHWFLNKIVMSRVWVKRGNRHTDAPTHALIVWEVGGGGREGLFGGFGIELIAYELHPRKQENIYIYIYSIFCFCFFMFFSKIIILYFFDF